MCSLGGPLQPHSSPSLHFQKPLAAISAAFLLRGGGGAHSGQRHSQFRRGSAVFPLSYLQTSGPSCGKWGK